MMGALEVKDIRRLARRYRDEGWKPIHAALLGFAAAHRNRKNGICFPEFDKLAEACGVTRKTVRKHLLQLVDWGAIKLRPQAKSLSSGKFRPVQIDLNFGQPPGKNTVGKNGDSPGVKKAVAVGKNEPCNKEEAKEQLQAKGRLQAKEQAQGWAVEQSLNQQACEIASHYPRVDDAFHLPAEIAAEIRLAIERHGRDIVLAGTRAMAEKVARWPKPEHRFLPSTLRYFRESQYRKDPEFWERSQHGKRPATNALRDSHGEDARARYAKGADAIVE